VSGSPVLRDPGGLAELEIDANVNTIIVERQLMDWLSALSSISKVSPEMISFNTKSSTIKIK